MYKSKQAQNQRLRSIRLQETKHRNKAKNLAARQARITRLNTAFLEEKRAWIAEFTQGQEFKPLGIPIIDRMRIHLRNAFNIWETREPGTKAIIVGDPEALKKYQNE